MNNRGVNTRPLLALGLLLLACGGKAESDTPQRGVSAGSADSDETLGAANSEEETDAQGDSPSDDVSRPPDAAAPGKQPPQVNGPDEDEPVPPPEPAPPDVTEPAPPTMEPPPDVCFPTTMVSEVEIARRLTQLLWDTDSTEGLGEFDTKNLSDPAARSALAKQMLQDPRAAQGRLRFVRRWLALSAAAPLGVAPEVWAGIQESTDKTVAWIIDHKEPRLLEFLSGADVVVTAEAAPFYRAEEAEAEIPAPGPHQFPERSVGLLTQIEWLMSYSIPPTRGAALMADLRCMAFPPKPAGLVVTPLTPGPNETTRETYAQHVEDPACAGCHSLLDPTGFLFEHFDSQGRYRSMENSQPVDTSGSFLPGEPLSGASELPEKLAGEAGETVLACAAVSTLKALSSGNSGCLEEEAEQLGRLRDAQFDPWLVQLVATHSFVAE